MKGKKIAVIFSMLLCLGISACGKTENPQDVIRQVKTNMEECQSMDFDLHVVSDLTAKYNETRINQKTEYNLNIKETPANAYITGTVSTSVGSTNNKYDIEAYQTSANGNYSLYYNENSKWYRQDTGNKKDFAMSTLKMFYDAGIQFSEETVMVNEKECYKISADVYGDAAKEFSDMFGITTSESEPISVTVYIYKGLNYPAYVKIDFKSCAKQILKNDELDVTADNLYMELTFNSFNETDVEIPEDIKKDAQKKTAEESGVIQEQEETTIPENTEEPTPVEEPEQSEQFFEEEPEETEETLSSDWNSFQFEYEGVIYRMPMSYKTFEASGFTMMEDERTMIMEAGQSYTTTLYKESYSVIAKIENTATSPKTLYECDIVSLDFDTYSLDLDQLAKFMFPNNINFAALYDNVVELWGEPTDLHDGEALKIATYQEDDNRFEVFFDPDAMTIIEVKITAR